jgi:hypothetical protein
MKRLTCIAFALAAMAAAQAWAADAPPGPPQPPPRARVETSLPTDGDRVPELAFDGKPDTFCRSARAAKAGDTFTLVLPAPVKVREVEVATGKPDGGETLEQGVLEISADGNAFTEAAALKSGAAKADLGGKDLRAVRLRATADGQGPIAVREIMLRSQPQVGVLKYPIQVVMDDSKVPEMKDWCRRSQEIIEGWYPVLAETLASDGYTPPRRIDLIFQKDPKGIAGTAGSRIFASDGWFKAHPDDYGALVHEAVHVVQSYPGGSPGWLVEGIADYVRCWVYEPQTPRRPLDPGRIRYQDSYQVTGAFLAYLVQKYDKEIVRKLNAACRKAQYKNELFKESTGKDLDTLWEEFRGSLKARG